MMNKKIYIGVLETIEYDGEDIKKTIEDVFAFSSLEEAVRDIPYDDEDEESPSPVADKINVWAWTVWSIPDEDYPESLVSTIRPRPCVAWEQKRYSVYERTIIEEVKK